MTVSYLQLRLFHPHKQLVVFPSPAPVAVRQPVYLPKWEPGTNVNRSRRRENESTYSVGLRLRGSSHSTGRVQNPE